MIVIVRLDLDRYDIDKINQLVVTGILSVSEAAESRAFKNKDSYTQLMYVRHWQESMKQAG
jgi:hypothetical protein